MAKKTIRFRYGQPPKARKRRLIIGLSLLLLLIVVFAHGPNGLVKVIYKTYQKHKLYNDIENLKIKAELIESKTAKGQNPEYLRKYLIDYYKMVPIDSSR
jgi:cell division protein FtsB